VRHVLIPPGSIFWWTAAPTGFALALLLGAANGALIAGSTCRHHRHAWHDDLLPGLCFIVMGDLEKSPFSTCPVMKSWPVRGRGLLVTMIFLLGGGWFERSRWRRELLMLGGNRVAARYAGIPVNRRILEVYALMGLLGFLSALCFTARNSSVSASSLTGLELQVIVAVVLGGTRVQGGAGSLSGTFFGVLIIAVMDEGLRGAARWGDAHLPFKISHLEYVLLERS